jgi:hypothetical protein
MVKFSKVKKTANPFLTIITRVFKRPRGLAENLLSIDQLINPDYEQIFINDDVGHGLLAANKSFSDVKHMISGQYVFLLDDDDFIVNRDMIDDLKLIQSLHDPDIIFFRMIIKNNMNNNFYPTAACWRNKPLIAHVGGSCFVVKKEIYLKHIHEFAKPRCGDFYFINAAFNDVGPDRVFWMDKLMCETGRVSRGKSE